MRYVSTRNTSKTYEFKDVFIKGLADDGGLFIPSSLPNYSEKEIQEHTEAFSVMFGKLFVMGFVPSSYTQQISIFSFLKNFYSLMNK